MKSLWLAAALSLATPVAAEILKVRSGEHSSFTRLAIDLQVANQWEIFRNGVETQLVFSSAEVHFDISSVFDRISKDRISQIMSSERTLKVHTACSCKVIAHLEGAKMLVLDFTSEPDVNSPPPAIDPLGNSVLTAPIPAPQISRFLEFDVSEDSGQTDSTVDSAQERLLASLSTSVSQGLVQIDPTAPSQPKLTSDPLETRQHPQVQLSTTTGIQNSALQARGNRNDLAMPTQCPEAESIDPATWAVGADFSSGLALLRDTYPSDRMTPDLGKTTRLAKHYLHFGLATEAIQLLLPFRNHEEVRDLLHLAALFENDHSATSRPLAQYLGCEGAAGLWGYLEEQDKYRLTPIDPQSVQSAYLDLPNSLKEIIGPKLVQKFRQMNLDQIADIIGRIENRTVQGNSLSTAPPRIVEKIAATQVATSGSELLASLQNDLSGSPDNRRKRLPEQDESELLQSFSFELRNDQNRIVLEEAVILALAKSGQFDAAFNALDTRAEPGENEERLHEQVEQQLIATATDLMFMKHIFDRVSRGILLADSNVYPASKRLIKLGFSEVARKLLSKGNSTTQTDERRVLRAELFVAEGNYQEAYAELLGLESARAHQLQREVKQALKNAPSEPTDIQHPQQKPTTSLSSQLTLAAGRDIVHQSEKIRTNIADSLAQFSDR